MDLAGHVYMYFKMHGSGRNTGAGQLGMHASMDPYSCMHIYGSSVTPEGPVLKEAWVNSEEP